MSINQGSRPLPAPPTKALELLCYLLIYRDRAHTRDGLAEVLWPEGDSTVSKRYLRQTLWKLNTSLRHGPLSEPEEATALVVDRDRVHVDPGSSWVDVGAFENARAATRDTPGHRLTEAQARLLESAVGLYRGDLMETSPYDWCGYERDRLRVTYLAMLEQLMDYCEACRLYARGIAFGQVILRHDLTRETTHRRLMRLHLGAGDRTSAMHQYDQCHAAMTGELGVRPSSSTVSLYEQIRDDRVADLPATAAAAEADAPPSAVTDALARLNVRLDQIQASLATLQRSLHQVRYGPPGDDSGTLPPG
ncbi:AfsR/SARP family transcriptional regulator [Sphaerisporangium corydalis]|uniref:BTAD domain-containing putative transcriptional regulator n=1 Tax=Sphaerisporangium corydalis TaxID=1441875 RepID=A0ABV9E603_9ACTN|nr:bacterial transcriptional activator domain-containing protein [Sphaerisporangium corydalis]